MQNAKCKGLKNRDDLIAKLTEQYVAGYGDRLTMLIGNSGTGKSYVVNGVLKQIAHKVSNLSNVKLYVNQGNEFMLVRQYSGLPHLDGASISVNIPLLKWGVSAGIGATFKNNTNQYQYIKRLIKNKVGKSTLFCVDNFSLAESSIKTFISLLIRNIQTLENELKTNIFVLLTDKNRNSFDYYILGKINTCSLVEMCPYDEEDIIKYLCSAHESMLINDEFKEKIHNINRICNGNLALVDFMFVDIQLKNEEYFTVLEKIVYHRLEQLKSNGKEHHILEDEMEDIILSSSLCLQKFASFDIAEITNIGDNIVTNSLNLAKKEAFLNKDLECMYEFSCDELQLILRDLGVAERKERLLYYYRYYTDVEQDSYYFRGYYLLLYFRKMNSISFALLCLSYITAYRLSDFDLINRIKHLFKKYGNETQQSNFKMISEFYHLLSLDEVDADNIYQHYRTLTYSNFELPLIGELTRACFHYLYINCPPSYKNLRILSNECSQYALNELSFSQFNNPISLISGDETIIRLNILYEVAPFILDITNDYDKFIKLYNTSVQLSTKTKSRNSKGLALYIQNVFNRKAFLFANQTQCDIYYEKAKRYFKEHQIWNEFCMTLVCQAGTNIVIQKYEDAQQYCKLATEIMSREGISLSHPSKIKNNYLIAQFLEYEQDNADTKNCIEKAKEIIKKLSSEIHNIPCATEFVILTNLCSLCLYAEDDISYLKYKHKLELLMGNGDIADVTNENVDDFYRYYFSWFEAYRAIKNEHWEKAYTIFNSIDGFIPALFMKQEIFWDKKNEALRNIICSKTKVSAYDFCTKLVQVERRETLLSRFFFRGLMLSDLQYTSE